MHLLLLARLAKRCSSSARAGNKKRRTVQTSLYKFLDSDSRSTSKLITDVNPPAVVIQAASTSRALTVPETPQDFGIHVYTQAQIESSKGMLKDYRLFWNDKAYELCSDVAVREKLKDKSAIQGAINVSWTLQRSSLLQVQADEIREESKTIYSDPIGREHLLTPIERNLKRVFETHAYIQQLCDHSDLPVDKLENTIDRELQELKKAQDALNKALESRRQDMAQVKRRMAETNTVQSPIKLSDIEIEDLAHSVKMESQIEDYEVLSDCD